MRRGKRSGLLRTLSEDSAEAESDEAPADNAGPTTEADYSFEGYSVEFIDKVALLPVSTAMPVRKAAP